MSAEQITTLEQAHDHLTAAVDRLAGRMSRLESLVEELLDRRDGMVEAGGEVVDPAA